MKVEDMGLTKGRTTKFWGKGDTRMPLQDLVGSPPPKGLSQVSAVYHSARCFPGGEGKTEDGRR